MVAVGSCADDASARRQLLVPLERYLASAESDQAMLKAYRAALRQGTITAARNPALHAVASALAA